MRSSLNRRKFLQQAALSAAGLSLLPRLTQATPAGSQAFSFVLLGDLHFDKLRHHDLAWLEHDKPDDLRQVRDYSRITSDIQPRLMRALRKTIIASRSRGQVPVAFALQVGDLVEGLCGSEQRAQRQNSEALDFVRRAKLGVPFLFTKGNHDITGNGAPEAFKSVFHPFLNEQLAQLSPGAGLNSARFSFEHRDTLFCFFDAYDKDSLPWLEAVLAKRTGRHCFVLVHPPVVPYGARSTWHLFASDREKAQRQRLLELLGQHNAFVLSGHIHKHNLLVRSTPSGGRFLQLGISSVIPGVPVEPRNLLGAGDYNPDQVTVEPAFSPATEAQRRAMYNTEARWVSQFQYADLPGYAVVTLNGSQVSARIYSGVSQQLWRSLELSQILAI